MTQKELAEMYGIKPHKTGLKDKKKAKEIIGKILQCWKCGQIMKWIPGTNQCVCCTCTCKADESEDAPIVSVTKTISEKSRKFLEDNYSSIQDELNDSKESEGVVE